MCCRHSYRLQCFVKGLPADRKKRALALVATLPAYLNALSGRGVHIVTVNEYLARFHAEESLKKLAALLEASASS